MENPDEHELLEYNTRGTVRLIVRKEAVHISQNLGMEPFALLERTSAPLEPRIPGEAKSSA